MNRPSRDLRAEATDRLTRLLRREQHPTPEALALELLVALDGIHIGLTDTTPPTNPDADPLARPADTTGPTPDYRAARQALKGQQQ